MKRSITINPDYAADGALRAWLETLPEHFEREGEVVYSGRNTLKAFALTEGRTVPLRVVVKRFARLSALQRVGYWLRTSKARKAFDHAAELRRRGFDTPTEVACYERRAWGTPVESYLVTMECLLPDMGSLLDTERATDAAAQFATYAARLHDAGILHHDLNRGNILCRTKADGTLGFALIDLNRMTFVRPGMVSRRQRYLNISRLTADADTHAAMLRAYAAYEKWNPLEVYSEGFHVKYKHEVAYYRNRRIRRRLFGRRR